MNICNAQVPSKNVAARNALLLSQDAKQRGAVAAVPLETMPRVAHHGRELGIPTRCTPIRDAVGQKRRCELLGAKVLRCGEHILKPGKPLMRWP